MSDPNRTQLGAPPTLDPNKTMMGTAPTVNATITIKPVQCPVCKTYNPVGVMFCIECGLIFDRALDGDAFGAPAIQLPCLIDQSGREHPVRPGTTVIGRAGDIMIEDGRISRRHAQISSESGVVLVEDLGSTNGTKLNGDAIGQGEMRPMNAGDKLSLGGYELTFSLPGESQKTAMGLSGRTAAIASAPTIDDAPAWLEGGEFKFALRRGMNSFGRKSENDLPIPDPYVSGKHGVIEIADDGIYLTDIGSTNGTMLNDAKLSPNMRTKITPDDVIRLGSIELRIRMKE